MNRRRFLAASLALLAGCNTNTSTTPGPDSPGTTTQTTTQSTTKSPISVLPAPHTTLTEQEVTTTITRLDCHHLPPTPDFCLDTNGKLDIGLSPTTTSLTRGELRITLTNTTGSTFTWNPYDWTVYTRGRGEWRKLAPVMIPAVLDTIPPGESHTYTITCTPSELLGIFSYRSETQINLYGLDPGPFGFTTNGHFADSPDTDYTAGTILGFYGDEPPIKPTTHVEATELDGDTLEIRTADAANTYLQLDFVDGSPDQYILADHIRQTRGLRNTLSYAPTNDISAIRYFDTSDVIENTLDYVSIISASATGRYGFRDHTFTLTTNYHT